MRSFKLTLLLFSVFICVVFFNVGGIEAKAEDKAVVEEKSEREDAKAREVKSVEGYVEKMESGKISKQMERLDTELVGLAGEGYSIIRTVSVIFVLISFIVGTVKMAGENSRGRSDGKAKIIKAAFCIFAVGAMASFITLLWNIGSSLF